MHAVELPRLAAAVPEAGQVLERLAVQDVDSLVRAVRNVQEPLLRIAGQGDIPSRAAPERPGFHPAFLDVGSVGLEDLNAVVRAVAHVQHAVIGQRDGVNRRTELVGLLPRLVSGQLRVVGFVAVGAPMPLVFARVRIHHDHAPIPVAVRHEKLVGARVNHRLGGKLEVLDVVAAPAHERPADLHQELSAAGEFQHHAVMHPVLAHGALVERERCLCRDATVPADPHVAFVVDIDAVSRGRPIVPLAGTAPMPDQLAGRIEGEYRRSGEAAIRRRRIPSRVDLLGFERVHAVDDPDVVVGIYVHPDRRAEQPMLRQRLGPERVDLEARRHDDLAVAGAAVLRR